MSNYIWNVIYGCVLVISGQSFEVVRNGIKCRFYGACLIMTYLRHTTPIVSKNTCFI